MARTEHQRRSRQSSFKEYHVIADSVEMRERYTRWQAASPAIFTPSETFISRGHFLYRWRTIPDQNIDKIRKNLPRCLARHTCIQPRRYQQWFVSRLAQLEAHRIWLALIAPALLWKACCGLIRQRGVNSPSLPRVDETTLHVYADR